MENVLAGVTEVYRDEMGAETSTESYILPSWITPSPKSYAAGFATVRYVWTQGTFNPYAPC